MASQTDRLTLLVQRIGAQCKAMGLRLVPAGGLAGQVLAKLSASDYALSWVSQPYGFALPCSGKPNASEQLGPWVSDRAWTLLNGLAGCIGKANVAFTAASIFTLTRNGQAVGTISFAANGTLGALATASNSDIAVARGDIFFLSCPASQDATGADIGFTFVGVR